MATYKAKVNNWQETSQSEQEHTITTNLKQHEFKTENKLQQKLMKFTYFTVEIQHNVMLEHLINYFGKC
jgi:hypothetical protein